MYFPAEDYTLSAFAIVNAGLYFLLQEKTWYAEGEKLAEIIRYQDMVRDNLETALSSLPLLLPSRRDSVEALLLGVC